MNATEFVQAVLLKAIGKVTTLTPATPKWQKIIALGNFYIDEWAREPNVDWNSLHSIIDIGKVTATDTFDLDTDIRKISEREGDYVRIIHADKVSFTDYSTTQIDRLKNYPDGYFVAKNGQQLKFNRSFKETDPQYGGTIQVPAFLYPEHLTGEKSEVPVDNPNWLVLITAANFVLDDVTKQYKYTPLANEANAAMERMRADNESQDTSIYRPWCPLGQSW